MSMPIFKAVAAALLCLGLSACVGGVGGGGAAREVAVTSDRVTVTGPDGYCIDPTATRDGGDTGFALLGNCAVLAASRFAAQPTVPAVLTAAVSAPGDAGEISGNLSALDAFFRSDEGLRLLSRSQDGSTVTILDTAIEGDVFLLHARDTSAGVIDAVSDTYWRAYMDIGRRIATLTVLARADRPISEAQSLSTLRQFVGAMRAANADISADPAATPQDPVAASPASAPNSNQGLWNFNPFRRILG